MLCDCSRSSTTGVAVVGPLSKVKVRSNTPPQHLTGRLAGFANCELCFVNCAFRVQRLRLHSWREGFYDVGPETRDRGDRTVRWSMFVRADHGLADGRDADGD